MTSFNRERKKYNSWAVSLRSLSRAGIIVSTLPGLLFLGLFYSLAIHMHRSLGRWPSGIGERGFPSALLTHAAVATNYFWAFAWSTVFILPAAILVCVLVSRWRHLIPFFALYGFMFIVSIVLMQLAPEPFLYWWWD